MSKMKLNADASFADQRTVTKICVLEIGGGGEGLSWVAWRNGERKEMLSHKSRNRQYYYLLVKRYNLHFTTLQFIMYYKFNSLFNFAEL